MKAVDTNIIVRFLTGDNEQQAKKVYNILKKAESKKEELFISLLVVLELIWFLESVYDASRSEILDSIKELLLMPIFKFEHQHILQQFITCAPKNKFDLSDLLITFSAKNQGCEKVLTFDKKASKFNLFELVK